MKPCNPRLAKRGVVLIFHIRQRHSSLSACCNDSSTFFAPCKASFGLCHSVGRLLWKEPHFGPQKGSKVLPISSLDCLNPQQKDPPKDRDQAAQCCWGSTTMVQDHQRDLNALRPAIFTRKPGPTCSSGHINGLVPDGHAGKEVPPE